ncbi:hypothetical protein AMATHDRAFT_67484 [Amanita thiersii Skay4041]|uniref:PCI domain-containing protein n=1 Tax=Amanita thiersii Skay4041 TaxID=703135 RepID=A0A2A9NH92_9AGAR|nr:hypothetical protein AMATHDRAFT_67484 [Amanita thiersii Skay4041]
MSGAMEVDQEDGVFIQGSSLSQTNQTTTKRYLIVAVDDNRPFELESYIANYTGRTAIDRLIHIVRICPSVAPEAFQLAVNRIKRSRDPSLFQALVTAYDQMNGNAGRQMPSSMSLGGIEPSWMEETNAKNQAERTKLEVELKTYSNNMIKESIRMAHRDLGNFYRATGEYASAMKHLTKSREYCTTSQHILDMCLSVVELMMEHQNYANITTYVFKAEAALEAATSVHAHPPAGGNATSGTSAQSQATAAATAKKRELEHVQTKLDLATAFAHLSQSNYEKAASYLLRLGPPKDLGDWVGKLFTPSDIAIYGALCALAGMSRGALKTQLEESKNFGDYLEQEPYVRELLTAYMNSNFKTVLELLFRYSTRHYLDIHLSSHVQQLMDMIRNWAIVLYFQPFTTIRLDRMGVALGWTVEETEKNVIALIQSGQIQGRIDSQNKILHAKQTDYRADLFARAMQAGKEIQIANRKMLLRMKLQQADLVVKPPKHHHHSQYHHYQQQQQQQQQMSYSMGDFMPGD